MKHSYSCLSFLSPELSDSIIRMQKEIKEMTDVSEQMDKRNPHLTLGSTIKVEEEKLYHLARDVEEVVANIKPFKVEVEGIGINEEDDKLEGFTRPPYRIVLLVKVTTELLNLVYAIQSVLEQHDIARELPTSPYLGTITVAAGDLNEANYNKLMDYYSDTQPPADAVFNFVLDKFVFVRKAKGTTLIERTIHLGSSSNI